MNRFLLGLVVALGAGCPGGNGTAASGAQVDSSQPSSAPESEPAAKEASEKQGEAPKKPHRPPPTLEELAGKVKVDELGESMDRLDHDLMTPKQRDPKNTHRSRLRKLVVEELGKFYDDRPKFEAAQLSGFVRVIPVIQERSGGEFSRSEIAKELKEVPMQQVEDFARTLR